MSVNKRLAEIGARAEAAEPGPWTHVGNEPGVQYVTSETGSMEAHIRYGEADAEFIAHAREDIPWLLSVLHSHPDYPKEEAA